MKAAFLIPDLTGGGAERVMVNLCNSFDAAHWTVHLVVLQRTGKYFGELAPGVIVHELHKDHMLSALPALVRYLRAERPDVLISALDYVNIVALMAGILAWTRTRFIVTVHQTISQVIWDPKPWKVKILPALIIVLYRMASAVVTVSQEAAEDLARVALLRRKRIDVVYNPVLSRDLPLRCKESVGYTWFQEGQPPVILGVGRFVTQKDFPTLIRAFAIVRAARPARLVLLGEGELLDSYLALARELKIQDDITLPGFVANPYAVMVRSRVFVLSSRWEALPTVLIEAIACGTRVVATNCKSGSREILTIAGTGQLVPVGDHEAMARAILQSLEGPPPVADAAFLRRFDIDTATEKYFSIVQRVLAS